MREYRAMTFKDSDIVVLFFFFFNDTATTEIYTLSLHDALPISILPTPYIEFEFLLVLGT